jgi:hypothetical protein
MDAVITKLLEDTHVLVMYDEVHTRDRIIQLFRSMGAKVHHAETQTQAIGLYFRLFRAGIRPRAVVTSWWMAQPSSVDYEFLKMLGREEIDATALDLFRNIVDLDATAFLSVYTRDPVSATDILTKYAVPAQVYNRVEIDPEAFVARIATHPGIGKQRMDEAHVNLELRDVRHMTETGQYRTLKTPLPGFLGMTG